MTREESSAQARRRHRVDALCAAAMRALSGDREVHFRARALHRGDTPLRIDAPHLHPDEDGDFGSFRGAADGIALRLSHSNPALHATTAPAGPVARLIHELLEQFRVEALVPQPLHGVRANVRHRHEQWSMAFHDSGLTESARGILVYTVLQVCRAKVTGEPVVEATEDLLETTRGSVSAALGPHAAALRRTRHDQAAYAHHAAAIATLVEEMVSTADAEEGVGEADDPARRGLPLLPDPHDALSDSLEAGSHGGGWRTVSDDVVSGYRVFTTSHDRELPVAQVVRRARLARHRQALDSWVAARPVNVARLARDLQAILAAPEAEGWEGGHEEGHVDGRRLARLVTAPGDRRLFLAARYQPVADCIVTFLLDCSGSMKQHLPATAALVDVFTRALDLAGVSSEVLGFTTTAWNGGQPQREWARAGHPPSPGRLNGLQHLVLKDADTTWRRARLDIAGLLAAEHYREGVDGEAVAWACRRLLAGRCSRRLLLVVSDGGPHDAATALANGEDYLDAHLAQVVEEHDRPGLVDVFGLGVGLDLSAYYARSLPLDLADGLTPRTLSEILGLLAGGRRRR